MITESDMDEISSYTDNIIVDNTINTFGGWDYSDCCSRNYNGGYNTMNINKNYAPCIPQTQDIVDNEFTAWSLDKCVAFCLDINKNKMLPTPYTDYLCAMNKHILPYFKGGKPLGM